MVLSQLTNHRQAPRVLPAVDLLPYQIASFNDRGRFKILMWCRGARKTFTTTLEIVDDCFEAESKGHRTTWVVLSRGDRQAKEAIQEAKRHCRAYLFNAAEVEESAFVSDDGNRRYTQHEIRFPLGSRIISLPANPDTARGYSANIYLDEFSVHKDDIEIWRALLPVLRGRYRIIVSSTPKGGRRRKFYQLVNDQSDIWSKHIVDVHQAVKQGLPLDIELEKKAMGDPTGWAQEFELQWIDEASVWLPYELMEPCENEDAGSPDLYQGQPCYIGIDIGRHSHRWVAWVLERMSDGKFWTREVVVLQNASFAEHDRVVARLMKQYRVIKLAADKTGIGEKPVEDWQNIYSEYRVEGVSFSNASKYALATIGRKAFEDQSWFVPDDDETREDFYKLKRSATATGAPRFDAAADSSGHADRAWAAFLALYAAGTIGDVAFSSSGSYTTSHWDEPANDETEIGGVLAVGGESWDTW